MVLLKNPQRIGRAGNKLAPHFIGPYKVTKKSSKGGLTVQNTKSKKNLKKTYNVALAKKYIKDSKSNTGSDENKDDGDDDVKVIGESTKKVMKLTQLPPSKRKQLAEQLGLTTVCEVDYQSSGHCPKKLATMKGDGNCLFRAISFSLTGSERSHMRVRRAITGRISEDNGSFIRNMCRRNMLATVMESKDPAKSYLDQSGMEKSGTWDTEVEIFAAAGLLQTDIAVYCKKHEKAACSFSMFPASGNMRKLSTDAIILDNSSGNHYNVVLC